MRTLTRLPCEHCAPTIPQDPQAAHIVNSVRNVAYSRNVPGLLAKMSIPTTLSQDVFNQNEN